MSNDLGIEDFEFNRTHWAIKDVDLFKVLIKHRFPSIVKPTIFNIDDICTESNLVAVMMPINSEFDNVYTTLRKASNDIKMKCLRVDDIWEDSIIMQDIFSLIYKARIVLCEIVLIKTQMCFMKREFRILLDVKLY